MAHSMAQRSEGARPGAEPGFLTRERTVAGPRFNRWWVPPAALAIHLSIGMAYAFSVFWLPMTRLLPGPAPALCASQGLLGQMFTSTCPWTVPAVNHIFETFIVMLGVSAALWGAWLEHAGPRKAGLIAASCWGGGLMFGGIGVAAHQLWLVYLGCGVIGGIGQGLGYITPVSSLIKWFPDRRGLATGLAIMGYGGGAMIGAPIAVGLMNGMSEGGIPGVAGAMILLGLLYLLIMTAGALAFRVPPNGWRPNGWAPPVTVADGLIGGHHVHVRKAWRTPQFWLLWAMLCLNVTAGIGVISMASPMLQDVFGTRLLGVAPRQTFDASRQAAIAAAAAGLVGLISLFNSVGRLAWAAASDYLGRRATYAWFFAIGIVLYASLPSLGHHGLAALFVIAVCLILSMYGGGFATIPAYLADLFGSQMVGAIHGRLLTAWSMAGLAGPILIASLRQRELAAGVAAERVYDRSLYILAGLLALGLLCNLLVRPVDSKHHMCEIELQRERALQHDTGQTSAAAKHAARGRFGALGVLAWVAVGLPFLLGVWIAVGKAAALF